MQEYLLPQGARIEPRSWREALAPLGFNLIANRTKMMMRKADGRYSALRLALNVLTA